MEKIERVIETESLLIEYLTSQQFSPNQISETIIHERAHIDKAKELGYEFLHYHVDCFEDGKLDISPCFDMGDINSMTWGDLRKKAQNMRKIALAPNNPSQTDIQIANKMNKTEENFKLLFEV